MFAKKFTHVEKAKRDEVAWTAVVLLNGGVFWATLWLYCLPHTWGLLPWGSWDTNWWKIFVYIFALFPFGGSLLIPGAPIILGEKFRDLATAEKKAVDFEDDFKTKLAGSADETMKFELPELTSPDTTQPLTKENGGEAKIIQTEFTSILGDMNIHEKYKK